uniref:Uncharacterized protein n=1 Tax=Globodera rostochiensis TaxID=31243 RepID=A0A914I063_GLORO
MTFISILAQSFLIIFSVFVIAQVEPPQQISPETPIVLSTTSTSSLRPGCPLGEELRICSFCDGTCRFPLPFCGFFCSLIPRCYCQWGHLRNRRGQCIPSDRCFSNKAAESYCCGTNRCLHCAVGYSCNVSSGQPFCRPHWYGIGLMSYDDETLEQGR